MFFLAILEVHLDKMLNNEINVQIVKELHARKNLVGGKDGRLKLLDIKSRYHHVRQCLVQLQAP